MKSLIKLDKCKIGFKLKTFSLVPKFRLIGNLVFVAESLGLPYLNAYLDAVGSNFTHGANFATAGSTIRPQNTTLHQSGFSPFSLNVQWYQFNDFHRRTQVFRSRGNMLHIYFAICMPL